MEAPKDEVADAKLELKQKSKKYKTRLAEARDRAWDGFKFYKECDKLKAKYGSRGWS